MNIYVIGAGGHAKVVLSTLFEAGFSVEGLFDDDPQKRGMKILGIEVIGALTDAKRMSPQCGVLAIGDNRIRWKLANEFSGWEWLTIVHPKAYVHPSVKIGPGTVVFAGAVIQPDTCIGAHVIINTGATVDHDCEIGDFAHLAPGVHLGGGVAVGEGTLLGIGAVVIPRLRIGEWSMVGAGTVVIRDLSRGVKAVGVPARILGGVNEIKEIK